MNSSRHKSVFPGRTDLNHLDRKLGVASTKTNPVDEHSDIGPHDGKATREASNRTEEVSKQDDYAVRLDEEADKCPSHENEDQAEEEGGGALSLLLSSKEEECLLRSDDDCQADEEKDLFVRRTC